MHACGSGCNHPAHENIRITRTAESRFCIRNNGGKIRFLSLCFIGNQKTATESMIDFFHNDRNAVRRIETLIGKYFSIEICICRNLPTTKVDYLQSCFHLFHSLVAGQCTKSIDIRLRMEQTPQMFGTPPSDCNLTLYLVRFLLKRYDIFCTVWSLYRLPPRIGIPDFFEILLIMAISNVFLGKERIDAFAMHGEKCIEIESKTQKLLCRSCALNRALLWFTGGIFEGNKHVEKESESLCQQKNGVSPRMITCLIFTA